MSDLLIILVVLGILIVVGVIAFNWWQERKYHSKISHDFKPSKRDVLIEDFQINTAAIKKEKNAVTFDKNDSVIPDSTKVSTTTKREPEIDLFSLSDPDASMPAIDDVEINKASSKKANKVQVEHQPPATGATDLTEQTLQLTPDWDKGEATDSAKDNVSNPSVPATKSEEALLPDTLHVQIDLIAVLYASIPLTQPKVLSVINDQLDQFSERHFCYGLSHTDEWVLVNESKPEAMFSKLVFSLQLADRGGAVSRATLNRFQHLVETVGLELSAHVEWQGSGDPLNAAVSLDQFCIEVDKTVGFHLLTSQGVAFHATKLRGLMESQGLVLGQDGKFHLYHSQLQDLLEFSVKNYEGNPFSAEMLKSSVMHGVTFQLDIPTVKNSADVFDRMTLMAKTIAKNLDANMVDDNRRELGDLQLEKIRQQLKMINATMIAKGIIPGSPHALRLFS